MESATSTSFLSGFIESLANISQIILVVGLYFAWRQISVAVKDIKIRSRREAGAFAIAQAERFAKEIIPEYIKIDDKLGNKLKDKIKGGLQLPTIPPVDFTLQEAKLKNFRAFKESIDCLMEDEIFYDDVILLTNKLESLSLSFTKGLADEEIVFGSLADAYCSMIHRLYFYYCLNRNNSDKTHQILGYPNTIELYTTWNQRLEKFKLEKEKSSLEEKKIETERKIHSASLRSSAIPPIGV